MTDQGDPQDRADVLDPDVVAADPLYGIAEPDAEELRAIEAEAEGFASVDLAASDYGFEVVDVDEELVRNRPVGRLIGPGAEDDAVDAVDDEPDAVAWRSGDDSDDLTAEEEAVHITSDPPFGEPGDGYLRPGE